MAILFMGGEEIDFSPLGTVSTGTNGNNFRGDYARCTLDVAGGTSLGNGWQGVFTQPSASFWLGARLLMPQGGLPADPGQPLLAFLDGAQKRVGLSLDGNRALSLGIWDDSNMYTKLAMSPPSQPTTLMKLDVQVIYGTQATVNVYVNQVQVLSYTGTALVTGASTSLSAFVLSSPSTTDAACWSEVIAAERDTRTLMLKTHVPATDAQGNQWAGTHGDIDEVGIDEADGISTNAPEQVSMFGVNALPPGNLAVRGFKVSGYAARGDSGPAHLDLGVTTANAVAFSTDLAIDTGWTRIGNIWETNPVTGLSWTQADINAIQIGVRSRS
jgi:hypothetical protein